MLFYPAALPLSARTLADLAGIIRRHRKNIESCWRKLNPGRQALLAWPVLTWRPPAGPGSSGACPVRPGAGSGRR
jgi:hypothetical protein